MATAILLALAGFLAIIGSLLGLWRGFARQTVRFVTVILAVFLSIVTTRWLERLLLGYLSDMSGDELVDMLDSIGLSITGSDYEILIGNVDPAALSYVIAVPLALIVAPIVFVFIFALFKLLMLIVHKIACAVCGFSRRPKGGWLSRMLGAVVGAAQGVVVAIVVTVPVVGLLTTAGDVVDTLEAEAADASVARSVIELYDDYVAEYAEDPTVNTFSTLGGKFIYTRFTSVEIEGTEYEIVEELSAPAAKILSGASDMQGFVWTSPTAKAKHGLTVIIRAVDESGYVKTVMIDVVRTMTDTYNEGGIKLEAEELLKEMVDSCFAVIGSINEESFSTDAMTVIDAYFILGREGALDSFNTGELDSVRGALTATYVPHELDPKTECDYGYESVTVLTKVIEILESNQHTKALITSLSKISISALASSFGSELNMEESYEIVKSGVDATLRIQKEGKDEETYKAEVRASLEETLANADIVFEEDEQYILDNMTDYVNDHYEELAKPDENGNPTISDDEINKVILSYYESYLNGEFDEEPQP